MACIYLLDLLHVPLHPGKKKVIDTGLCKMSSKMEVVNWVQLSSDSPNIKANKYQMQVAGGRLKKKKKSFTAKFLSRIFLKAYMGVMDTFMEKKP